MHVYVCFSVLFYYNLDFVSVHLCLSYIIFNTCTKVLFAAHYQDSDCFQLYFVLSLSVCCCDLLSSGYYIHMQIPFRFLDTLPFTLIILYTCKTYFVVDCFNDTFQFVCLFTVEVDNNVNYKETIRSQTNSMAAASITSNACLTLFTYTSLEARFKFVLLYMRLFF